MKNLFSLIFAFVLMLAFCANVIAAPQSFETEGIFIMGDDDTKTKAKEYALQDAKRLALEQAGTYLKSITQVINGQVTLDELTVIASGVIKLERVISEEPKLENKVILFVVKARFVIDSDDIQKKIEEMGKNDKQNGEFQELTEWKKKHYDLLIKYSSLNAELAQTKDHQTEDYKIEDHQTTDYKTEDYQTKEQVLIETQEIDNQLTAIQWIDKGKEYQREKNYNSAIEAFGKAFAIDPELARDDYAGAYNRRGYYFYLYNGEFDLAISDFSRVIQLKPDFAHNYINRGNSYAAKGQDDLALADYGKAIQLAPKRGYERIRGNFYAAKGQYNLAIADYSNISLCDDYSTRGNFYNNNGDYALALADFNRAIEKGTLANRTYFYIYRGIFYAQNAQDKLALADFDKAIKLRPDDFDYYIARGNFYASNGQDELALTDFNKAIEIKPYYSKPYSTRGDFYANKGQDDFALADYNKAIELEPDSEINYIYRGNFYANKGHEKLALADFNKAIRLNLMDANGYYNRGKFYAEKGQFDLALADINRALGLNPLVKEFHDLRNKILGALNQAKK